MRLGGCFQVKMIFSSTSGFLREKGGMFHDVMPVITAYNNALIAPMLSQVFTRDPGIVRAIKVILNIGVIGSLLCLHGSTSLCGAAMATYNLCDCCLLNQV